MSPMAVLQSKILQYGRKGYILFELRLSGVSHKGRPYGFVGVCCSREVAAGFVGISGNRAKVDACDAVLVDSREIVYGCEVMGISRSEDHYELFILIKMPGLTTRAFFVSIFIFQYRNSSLRY